MKYRIDFLWLTDVTDILFIVLRQDIMKGFIIVCEDFFTKCRDTIYCRH